MQVCAKIPTRATSSSYVSCSSMPFDVTTNTWLALRTVAKRRAITIVSRFSESPVNDCWINLSVSISSAEVASSSIKIGGFF